MGSTLGFCRLVCLRESDTYNIHNFTFFFIVCNLLSPKLLRQVEAPDVSASVPVVSGDIDAEGAIPSVDVDVPSASASLDMPGESLHLLKSVLWRACVFL